MNQDQSGETHGYKVVLVFSLEPGAADEELRRSAEEGSFPDLLSRQPGFVGMELVRISDDRTLSIQTWETERDWWSALEKVKQLQAQRQDDEKRESLVRSREFLAGPVALRRGRDAATVYRVDRFTVPRGARDEFLARVRDTHRLLHRQPGFVRDALLECESEAEGYELMTIAAWRSRSAIDAARVAVRNAHREKGFDPATAMAELGITADLETYTIVGS